MTKTILIVDDSQTVRMYHKQILTNAGYECEEAENGMEALEKAQYKDYDLYIVDINMPVLDGYSFVERLRMDEKRTKPVIVISTESEFKDINMAYKSGANLYLVKPVKPEVLLMNVKILIS